MEKLAEYPTGWSIIGELDDSFIAVSYGDTGEPSPNVFWDLSDEDSLVTRSTIFADLLERLTNATIVDTDHLSGIVVDASGYDYLQIGDARGLFYFKGSDTDTVYVENGHDDEDVAAILRDYVPEESDTEDVSETE